MQSGDSSTPPSNPRGPNRVSNSPLQLGGTSFRTHRLVEFNSEKWGYKPTLGALLFATAFMGFFAVPVILFDLYNWSEFSDRPVAEQLGLGLFLLFPIGSIIMMYQLMMPRIFDRRNQVYLHGFKKGTSRKEIPFADIYALQILQEYIPSGGNRKRGYHSYELNIVRKDGSRENVIDHSNLDVIREEAQRLGQFMGVPVLSS
ncbi:hypothetical protein [Pontibacter sp. G13]|uniref:hypothetical protein n=1 Tax=Pontibacter sp. G13 TaxID=3074898 RepID=UPI00288B4805|nr:hypothetical protein [Pontibacter sp. G13]WNJ17079.1 hypothetical protein RJD25_19670 [Pontibacter sp. G13]